VEAALPYWLNFFQKAAFSVKKAYRLCAFELNEVGAIISCLPPPFKIVGSATG